MIELIVVLVIMGILVAIAVPSLTAYIHLSQFRRNESYAKTMYLSAESALTDYRTGGKWEDFEHLVREEGTLNRSFADDETLAGRIYALRLDKDEYGSGDGLTGDGALVAELLAVDTYDKSILNGAICLEVDVVAGQVYSVFYGTACDGLCYGADHPADGTWLDMDARDYDARRAVRLGYYSVQDVSNVVELELTRLKITSISLVNSEQLTLSWTSNSRHNDRDVRFALCFYRASDDQLLLKTDFVRGTGSTTGSTIAMTVENQGAAGKAYTFPLRYEDGRFTLTLDAMMTANLMDSLARAPETAAASSTSITRFGGALASPLDIYATVQALPTYENTGTDTSEYTASTVTKSNTANTMFADGTSGTDCRITLFRHLSNIRFIDTDAAFTVTSRSMDYLSDSVVLYDTDAAGQLIARTPQEAAFPVIPQIAAGQTLRGDDASNSIANVRLASDSLPQGARYLGLVAQNHGTIASLRLTSPTVEYTGGLYAAAALCGLSDGALENVSVDGAASVAVTLTDNAKAEGIGGVVGALDLKDGTTAASLSMAGSVTGSLPLGGAVTSGIGGVAGCVYSDGSAAALSGAHNAASVTGNVCVGGIAGSVLGTRADGEADLSGCSNDGLVLADFDDYIDGTVTGQYVGGVVGYAKYALISACSSRSGQAEGFVYSIDHRSKLRGRYVGGIAGYGETSRIRDCSTLAGGYVLGDEYVGGVIGANVVALSDDTTVSGLTVSNRLGQISATAFCGGLIGYHRTYAATQLGYATMLEYLRANENNKNILLPSVADGTGVPNDVLKTANTYILTIHPDGNDAGAANASNDMSLRGGAYVGGIVGYCDGDSRLVLKNCRNTGSFALPAAELLTGTPFETGADIVAMLQKHGYADAAAALTDELGGKEFRARIIGGVIGVNGENQVIDGCVNTGAMNNLTALGGVVGLNEGLIVDCVLSGNLGSATQDYVGGIAGLNVGRTGQTRAMDGYTYTPGTIENCSTDAGRTVTGQRGVGGIVGCNLLGGVVQGSASNANVTGSSAVGGIAGENEGVIVVTGASGTRARRVTGLTGGSGVGGVIGLNTKTGTLEVRGTGDVRVTDANLTVTGSEKVGGVIGVNAGAISVPAGTATNPGYLVNNAQRVQATNGEAGGVIGAQEGTGVTLSRLKNTGALVTANTGTAGGIIGVNAAGNTLKDCVGSGSVTSSSGLSGGICAENFGTVDTCFVRSGGTSEVEITSRGVAAAGAVCAVNRTGAVISGSAPTSGVRVTSDNARIFGAIVGDNYGTVRSSSISYQPTYRANSAALTVGGAVGRNSSGGAVESVTVSASFENFTGYRLLGGVVGENSTGATTPVVKNCTFSGTITRKTASAAGDCYGGIAGLNSGTLSGCTVSGLTMTITGTYTATPTSTAAQKEALSAHIGGVAGKNNETGTIEGCMLVPDSKDPTKTGRITVNYGMVGGIAGYNKGTISGCGGQSVSVASNVQKVSKLLEKTKAEGFKADTNYINTNFGSNLEDQYYNGTSTKVSANRTAIIIVESNGNLGGITGYNAPTGALDRCVSGQWLLVNRSESIGVGTGGIIGMNESEKDLEFLVNRAFVGRQLASPQTNRFAGGIIGNQVNSTTSDWTIRGCINYGTVYCLKTHYSGGILGQWTGNGGTIEGCYNYGVLQTSAAIGSNGASGGIVAQLYHATSGQSFNILSCQNYGSLYRAYGTYGDGANDSAGILGNITTFNAISGGGQQFTINAVDCVNGAGVAIYSKSMASGVIGYLSTDGPADGEWWETLRRIKASTNNVVINIDRCRNYAEGLYQGQQDFQGGLFGDRYTNGTNAASKNTYIQNSFAVCLRNNGPSPSNHQFVSLSSGGNSIALDLSNVGNNYYFNRTWGLGAVADGEKTISGDIGASTWGEDTKAGAREVGFGTIGGQYFAAAIGPQGSVAANQGTVTLYHSCTPDKAYMDSYGMIHATYDSTAVIAARRLFMIPTEYNSHIGSNSELSQYIKTDPEFDTYVRETYRDLERLADAAGTQLAAPDGVSVVRGTDGRVSVTITDDSRPLYYEGELLADGVAVMTGLRFIPTQLDQGKWDANAHVYTTGTTTGMFQIPESLRQQLTGRKLTLRVRSVSLFEDRKSSDWHEGELVDTAFLPTPDIRIQLVDRSTAYQTNYVYRITLNNIDSYAPFTNWQVAITIGGSTYSQRITANQPYLDIGGQGVQELTATATADAGSDGVTPTPAFMTVATHTPSGWLPDARLTSLTAAVSGDTLGDLTITATLATSDSGFTTPPVYRVELIGQVGGEDVVFAYDDALLSANSAVSVRFSGLPAAIFGDGVSNLRVRAWYAASGLGPVYTYAPVATSADTHNVAIRTYTDDEAYTESYLYSTVIANSGTFGAAYNRSVGLNLAALPAPVLADDAVASMENGSLYYTFSWDAQLAATANARYTVSLVGVTADGNRVDILTDGVYTDPTARSFKIGADDWRYTAVILTVTRQGSAAAGQIGLPSTKEYAVRSRLERPGQPTVENIDTNELRYEISWPAISSETGCASYAVYVQYEDGTQTVTDKVAELTASGSVMYQTQCDFEDYAGRDVTVYVVAVAEASSGYEDSANGVSYTLTVPSRLAEPNVSWAFSWTYDSANPTPAADYRGGRLTVTVTPADDASRPAGGSTYLLKAVIYDDADGTKQIAEYPASGVLSMNDAGGGSAYQLSLTDLATAYAGKYIRFYTRISYSAGQVSSAWVESAVQRLPRVQLDRPTAVTDSASMDLAVLVSTSPELAGDEYTWSVNRTTVSWSAVENADVFTFALSDGTTESRYRVRETADGAIVERETADGWEEITAEADGQYVLNKGADVRAAYTPTGSANSFVYTYSLDTLLQIENGVYRICLPNATTITTNDGQVITIGDAEKVQTKRLTITADVADNLTGQSDAFAPSSARELTF